MTADIFPRRFRYIGQENNGPTYVSVPQYVPVYVPRYVPTYIPRTLQPAANSTYVERPAPYPAATPSTDPKDCLIVATEAIERLRKTSCWARIAGFDVFKDGRRISGHAVVLFQPVSGANTWMYDKAGSRNLYTSSHDLSELTVAMNRVVGAGYRIQDARWVDQ
jgi:hypothetical protein